MAGVAELRALFVIVMFIIGAVFGLIFVVAAGVKAEENLACRRRATVLRDGPTAITTRGVRRLTGVGSISED
jgi:hypothetical protein